MATHSRILAQKIPMDRGAWWAIVHSVTVRHDCCAHPIFSPVVVVQRLSCVRLLQPHGLQPARLLCSWDSPGKNTGVGCHFLLQGIVPTQELNPGFLHCRQILYQLSYKGSLEVSEVKWLSRVPLFATPWTVAYHASLSMGLSRQDYWSGLPFPSPGKPGGTYYYDYF